MRPVIVRGPRVGVGDASSDAQAELNSIIAFQSINAAQLATLMGYSAALSAAAISATIKAGAGTVPGVNVVQAWNEVTSNAANTALVSNGASNALSLVEHGYDPDSQTDNQEVIATIAGAVSLIPGVGTMLGGALMLLDAIGEGIADLMEKTGLIWFGCRTSGNATAAIALEDLQNAAADAGAHMPSSGSGTFAALVMPMLMQARADEMNCKQVYGGLLTVVLGAALMWNKGASGPPMYIYVPELNDNPAGIAAFGGSDQTYGLGFSSGFGGSTSPADAIEMAFQPMTAAQVTAFSAGQAPVGLYTPPPSTRPAFILELAGSTYSATTSSNAVPVVTPSSAGKAAVNTAATVVTVAPMALTAGALLYSWAVGKSVDFVVSNAWKHIKGILT